MADFSPPFASNGGINRSPTSDEQDGGFQCGPADQTLFNRLFGRIEAELHNIQVAGGITGTELNDASVLQAIQALIAAATGGGATADYVLFSQAQTRMPIFPEIRTADGKMGVNAPSTGVVRVPSGISILHRGIVLYNTVQTDFATVASKTYHLRWQASGGVGTFVLKDLADNTYNPTTASEDNAGFDSTYDDMLVARVVTNSGNVATITNLVNFHRLVLAQRMNASGLLSSGVQNARCQLTLPLNWARTPKEKAFTQVQISINQTEPDRDVLLFADFSQFPSNWLTDIPVTRYQMDFVYMLDGMNELPSITGSVAA